MLVHPLLVPRRERFSRLMTIGLSGCALMRVTGEATKYHGRCRQSLKRNRNKKQANQEHAESRHRRKF